MMLTRALAAAALAGAALAAPANAVDSYAVIIGQDYLYTISTSTTNTLLGHLDATCSFSPDRWTADYGPTGVSGTVVTTGGYAWVRCEIYSWGYLAGDSTFGGRGPVFTGSDYAGPVAERPRIQVCISAAGELAGTWVETGRTCRWP